MQAPSAVQLAAPGEIEALIDHARSGCRWALQHKGPERALATATVMNRGPGALGLLGVLGLLGALLPLAALAAGCGEEHAGAPPGGDVATETGPTCSPAQVSCDGACRSPCPGDTGHALYDPCVCLDPSPPRPGSGAVVDETFCVSASIPGGGGPADRKRREFFFKALADMGIRKVRAHFLWRHVEPKKGSFSWGATDLAVSEAAQAGFEIVGLLAYGNPWASAQGAAHNDDHYPPDDPADFAAYASETVARYGDEVRRWEVWNEQNSGFRFWKGTGSLGGDPKAYGALLEAAHVAIKGVDPDAVVGYGGLFYLPQLIPGALPFAEASFAAHPKLIEHFEAFAWHPYSPYPPVLSPDEAGDPSSGVLQPVAADETARRIRSMLASRGKKNARLWVTELGWPTVKAVSEEDHARYLVRAYALLLSEGVELLCWYTWMDHHPDKPSIASWEKYFGLYRWGDPAGDAPPQPKPAVAAHRVMHETIGALRFSEDESSKSTAGRQLAFVGPGGGVVHLAWDPALSGEQTRPAAFKARPGREYSGLRMDGAPLVVSTGEDGLVRFEVGGAPVYVVETAP